MVINIWEKLNFIMGTNEVKIIVVYSFIPINMDTLRREKREKNK